MNADCPPVDTLPLHSPIVDFPVNFQSRCSKLPRPVIVLPFQTLGEGSECISATQAVRYTLGSSEEDEIISKGYGIILRRQDFWTLNNHRWLNDQVSLCFLVYSLKNFLSNSR